MEGRGAVRDWDRNKVGGEELLESSNLASSAGPGEGAGEGGEGAGEGQGGEEGGEGEEQKSCSSCGHQVPGGTIQED